MIIHMATFDIKGLCVEDFISILATNGYMTRTTLKPQNVTYRDWTRTVEVFYEDGNVFTSSLNGSDNE